MLFWGLCVFPCFSSPSTHCFFFFFPLSAPPYKFLFRIYNFRPDYAIITTLNHLLCELAYLIKTSNKFGFICSTAKWLAPGLEWASPGTVCFPTLISPINVFQLRAPCRKSPNCASFHALVQGREIFIGKEDKTVYNRRHNYNVITNPGGVEYRSPEAK